MNLFCLRFLLNWLHVFYLIFSVVFGLFFVMNLVLWSKGSSGAVPFSTLVALLALWFGVSVPLTFVGAYFGFRKRVSWIFNELNRTKFWKKNLMTIFVLWKGTWTSSPYEPDSTSNSWAIDLHTTNTRHHNGRCSAIRLHFHSIVLHSQLDLVESNVLHVRIFVLGMYSLFVFILTKL